MLLTKGNASGPWRILEVSTNQAPDVITLRLSKELTRIHDNGVQALIPFRRNSNGDPEWIVEHVYVRGANGSLRQLAAIPGIDYVRQELAEEWWIRKLLEEDKGVPDAITVGMFVRILTGPCARLCGHITTIQGDRCIVTIAMQTKRVRVHSLAKNLQSINCPAAQQVFFYRPELFA